MRGYPVAAVRGRGIVGTGNGGGGDGGDVVHVFGVEWNQSTDTWTSLTAASLERYQGVEFNQSTDTWTVLVEDNLVLASGVEWDISGGYFSRVEWNQSADEWTTYQDVRNDTWAALEQGIEE